MTAASASRLTERIVASATKYRAKAVNYGEKSYRCPRKSSSKRTVTTAAHNAARGRERNGFPDVKTGSPFAPTASMVSSVVRRGVKIFSTQDYTKNSYIIGGT